MAVQARSLDRFRDLRRHAAVPAAVAFPTLALLISLALPDAVSLSLSGLYLPIYRIALVFLLPLSLIVFLRNTARLSVVDYCIVGFAVLQAVSLSLHYGPTAQITVVGVSGSFKTSTFVNAGTTLLETLGPYFVARAYVTSRRDVASVARLLIYIAIVLSATTLVESLSGRSLFQGGPEGGLVRFGLHRASGPFPHPILWGLFAASTFAFSLAKDVVRRQFAARASIAALLFVAVMTSVSSAALAAVAIQLLLLVWFYLSRGLRHRGYYFASGLVAFYLFVDLFSHRTPIQAFFTYAALDPWTGYYRTLIWQFGWVDFLASPWIGIGYEDWARPRWMGASIDAFWLVLLLRYGLLAVVPLFAGIAGALRKVAAMLPDPRTRLSLDLAHFWFASLIALLVAGFTVHFWQQSFVELFFLIGLWGAFAQDVAPRAIDTHLIHRRDGVRGVATAMPARGRGRLFGQF